MATMTDLEKPGALRPHWLEHNAEHADESRLWAEKARIAGRDAVAGEISLAAREPAMVNEALDAARQILAAPS